MAVELEKSNLVPVDTCGCLLNFINEMSVLEARYRWLLEEASSVRSYSTLILVLIIKHIIATS